MRKVLHPANTRGTTNFGWLQANYSFSFGNFFNPDRLQFGQLRVLNDDIIAAGMGFGTHPHDNMEIVTIPLRGALKHRDSMNHEAVIEAGEVQVMSAGTGVQHSEFNANSDKDLNTLQIWVFPEKEQVEPRYDQKKFSPEEKKNKLLNVVSPQTDNDGKALWVHQQTYFNLGELDAGLQLTYQLHQKTHGAYLFLIEGEIEVADETLHKRDAIGIWEIEAIDIKVIQESKLLLIEVPMS